LAQAVLAHHVCFPSRDQPTFKMAVVRRLVTFALLFGGAAATQIESECVDGECSFEENSLLALRGELAVNASSRRRKPTVHCKNKDKTAFVCAGGDHCCGGGCAGQGDLCCTNVKGDKFPCQGGGECCGNACAAPGSKCCKPKGPRSAWYPVSKGTECRKESVVCKKWYGATFECASGNKCCGGACVAEGDVCCKNARGDGFSCQGNGGGCCGNACYAPGSKCCKSPWVAMNRWYPVTQQTKCAF